MDLGSALIFHNASFPEDPLFNHATRIAASGGELDRLIRRIEHEYSSRGLTPCAYAAPWHKGFNLALERAGFRLHDKLLVMVASSASPNQSGVRVEVVDDSTLRPWSDVFIEAFGIPASWALEVYRRSRLSWSNPHTSLYLGYDADAPAGCLALYLTLNAGGIYCVGTSPAYRRRGLARAMVHRAIRDSKRAGRNICLLQTLGADRLEGFYIKLGFLTAYTKEIYTKNLRSKYS